jgi:hypothetical protein
LVARAWESFFILIHDKAVKYHLLQKNINYDFKFTFLFLILLSLATLASLADGLLVLVFFIVWLSISKFSSANTQELISTRNRYTRETWCEYRDFRLVFEQRSFTYVYFSDLTISDDLQKTKITRVGRIDSRTRC